MRVLLLGCILWGVSFPTAKALEQVQSSVLPGAGSWYLTGITMGTRFGVSAVVVLLLLLRKQALAGYKRSEMAQGVGLGLLGGLGMLFQLDGLAHTEASTSAFLTQGSVIFIPVVKSLLDRCLPSLRIMLCCVLALAGVALLSKMDWHHLQLGRGEGETLIAALFFTGQILWLERPRYFGNDSLRVSLVMFVVVSLISLTFAASCPQPEGQVAEILLSPAALLFLAVLIGPCTLMAFLWMNRWQRHVSATTAGLIYCLEPVFATALALVLPGIYSRIAGINYLNESPDLTMIIGGGLIVGANLLMLTGRSTSEVAR